MPDTPVRKVAIFVSSPNDVAPERGRVQAVAVKLNREYEGLVRFETVLWEEHFYTADKSFQPQIPESVACEIVVSIFWTRIGTEMPADFPRMPDGKPYASGTAYELLTALEASKAKGVPDVYVFRKTADAVLPTTDTGRRRQAQTQFELLEAFWSEWFRSEKGEFRAAFQNFPSTDAFEQQAELLLRQWLETHGLLGPRIAWPKEKGSPFRGLAPFEAEHAAVFFGRDRAIDEARRLLVGAAERGTPFLLIVGASGAGKSSLARAGLIPRLTTPGVTASVDLWRVARMKPGEGQAGPLMALATALLAPDALPELAHGDYPTVAVLADNLRRGGTTSVQPIASALARVADDAQRECQADQAPKPALALLVDQLEEVFAQGVSEAERAAFGESLRQLIATGRVWVVATLRADLYELLLKQPALKRLKETGASLDLGPPGPAELAEIVRAPAKAAALVFENEAERGELSERLLADAKTADSLPLLQFTLRQLYARQEEIGGETKLTHAAYDELGGLAGAIAGEAERAVSSLLPEAVATLPRLLRRLAEPARDGTTLTLREVSRGDVASEPAEASLVDALLTARILIARTDANGRPTMRLAHDHVLAHWPRASEAAQSSREFYRVRAEVEDALRRWQAQGHVKDRLIQPGVPLAEAEKLVADFDAELPAELTSYVAASRYRARMRQRLVTAAAIFFFILAAAATATGVWAYRAQQQALLAQKEAERRQVNLLAELANSERLRGNVETALRLGAYAGRLALILDRDGAEIPAPRISLATTVSQLDWRLMFAEHRRAVHSADFSPDGSRIATASSDQTVRIWDAVSGKELAVLSGHQGWVSSVVFSPDGSRIVTASPDRTAGIWDVASGLPIAWLRGHDEEMRSAVFSPDGKRIVTASWDYTARIWDAATGKEIAVLRGHSSPVEFATFSPDGSRIVTASWDKTARIWDAATGKEILILSGHGNGLRSVAFSPDGLQIATASSDQTVRIWEATSGREVGILRGHQNEVRSVVFSPDGSRIVTASVDNTARIWDAASRGEVAVLRGHQSRVAFAVFSPDGKNIVTASWDGTARVWAVPIGGRVTVLRGHGDGHVLQWGHVQSAAFSPDGKRVVTASWDGTARIWDASSAKELALLRGHEDQVDFATFSPNGKSIVTASQDKTARIWDAASGKEFAILHGHTSYVRSAVFSPDGKRIVTVSWDKTARIWDAATTIEIVRISHSMDVQSAAFSPDGSRIITGSTDKGAYVWDAESGKQIAVLRGHESWVVSTAFNRDGSRIVTASQRTAHIWDTATAKEIAILRGHADNVSSAAFGPDGTRIVTASVDNTARIWDTATGKEIAVLRGHGARVNSAAFSPDGAHVVTSSGDKTARIWDVRSATMSTKDLVVEVCTRRLRGLTKLSRDEMRLAGYPDRTPELDVCAGIE